MKPAHYFVAFAAALLSVSCGSENTGDTAPEVKTYAPAVRATIGELTDANPAVATRAGVVEDNPDYDEGEKFYWHDGDMAKVLFFADGNLNATPTELIYTAKVAGGVKSNTCEFTTTGSVPAGDYAVYALYPAYHWSKDATGYKVAFPSNNYITFSDASSTHLGNHIFMRADAGEVTISDDGDEEIDLDFEHLTSVIRFHITGDNSTAGSVELSSSINLGEVSTPEARKFFNTSAYLETIDGAGLNAPDADDQNVSKLELLPMVDIPFEKDGSTWSLDCWMPVFPTVGSTAAVRLGISTFITVDGGDVQQQFGTDTNPLTFDDELDFMPGGFEAGKSYYFNLKADIGGTEEPPAPTMITPAAIPGVTIVVGGNSTGNSNQQDLEGTEQYTASILWSISGQFDYEEEYSATITLTPREGYTFEGLSDEQLKQFTVNGVVPSKVEMDRGNLEVSVDFPKTPPFDVPGKTKIPSAPIMGLADPVSGEMPDMEIPDTEFYTATVTWYIDNNNSLDGPFGAGTAYTALIELRVKEGYWLSNKREDLYLFTVNGITPIVYNDFINGMTLSVEFSPTEGTAVTYAVGDPWPSADDPQGVVYSVSSGGQHGMAVSLDEANVAWSTIYNTLTEVDNEVDGQINMNWLRDLDDDFSDYPAFAWAHAKNPAETTYEYGKFNVWYLPAVEELQLLYCAFNGKPAQTWDVGSDPISENNDAKKFFNDSLTTAGGTAISDTEWYWSSTEALGKENNALQINYKTGFTYSGDPKTTARRVRAILAF
ncbi:MAG: DUF1566 domain-containing protein [Alistipes sp.]|jgi:hypothetical protein|nr:DUF1566 domain-containing protein [Alistipes sp.]